MNTRKLKLTWYTSMGNACFIKTCLLNKFRNLTFTVIYSDEVTLARALFKSSKRFQLLKKIKTQGESVQSNPRRVSFIWDLYAQKMWIYKKCGQYSHSYSWDKDLNKETKLL